MSERLDRKKIIIGLVVLAALTIVLSLWKRNGTSTITYRKIPVVRGSVNAIILSTGTVAPENRVEIKPPVAGRIEKVIADEGQDVKKGQILAWMSSTERAALLDAARAKGPDEVKRWEDFYKATPILAPISGAIILRNVEEGQTFTNVDSVYSMSDRLTVKAQVDETDLAQIKLNQEAQIVLDAYANEKIPGHVDRIAYDAKIVNNVTTYVVDVLPDQTPSFMRSGMTANVSFLLNSKTDVLILPSEAVKTQDHHTTVFLADSKNSNKGMEKAVVTGVTDGKIVEILSGLNEGDTVLMPQLQIKGGKTTGSTPFSMGIRH